MAVTRAGNVIKVTADNDEIDGKISICGIKIVEQAGAVATVLIKKKDTSGVVLFEAKLAANEDQWSDPEIEVPADGVWFDITGSVNVYLYV